MSPLRLAFASLMPFLAGICAAEDPLDTLEERLVFADREGRVGARLSGTLDLEAYRFGLPAPGLLYTERRDLLNPRLSLFFDAQLGHSVYAFAQVRADRGFDPGDGGGQLRVDEYALRVSPLSDGRLSLQAGKFATVVGSYVARHGSWSDPFITAPLAYESLTGIWDAAAAGQGAVLLHWSHVLPGYPYEGDKEDKERRLPLIWGPAYASGFAISGRLERMDYAFELKNASLASRPDSWETDGADWRHPTWGGRLGYRPNPAWNFGFSASAGPYLRPEAELLAPGHGLGDYQERLLGQDIRFSRHHLELWAELFEVRFENPRVGPADVVSYHLEARYRFTPQFLGALRWNQQLYGRVEDGLGGRSAWGKDQWRIDLAPAYRFTAHVQLKVQYSLLRTGGPEPAWNHLAAVQWTLRL
jgi:hypothetical protein